IGLLFLPLLVLSKSDPHEGIPRQRWHVGGAIDQKIAVVIEPDALPRKRLGRRPRNLLAVLVELAAMTGTRDQVQLRLPRGHAAQVRAHGAERKVALVRVDDVNAGIDVDGDAAERIAVGLARVDHGRRFVENIGFEILICDRRRSRGGDAQRAESEFREKLAAVDCVVCKFVVVCHVSLVPSLRDLLPPSASTRHFRARLSHSAATRLALQHQQPTHPNEQADRSERFSRKTPTHAFVRQHLLLTYFCKPAPIDATEIKPVGSAGSRLYDSIVIVPTGQRIAHSPQRMHRVSSFNMAAPVTTPRSSAATSSNSTPKHSWLSRMCCTVSGSNAMRSSETSSS